MQSPILPCSQGCSARGEVMPVRLLHAHKCDMALSLTRRAHSACSFAHASHTPRMPSVARSVHLPQQRRRRADTVAPPLRQAVYGVEHKARRLRAAQQAEAEAAAEAAPPAFTLYPAGSGRSVD